MAFGMDVDDFQDFTNSFYTLFLIILGEFDFEQLRLANDLLGPVLFVSYVVIVYLILFNMFLAIIGEAYAAPCSCARRAAALRSAPGCACISLPSMVTAVPPNLPHLFRAATCA